MKGIKIVEFFLMQFSSSSYYFSSLSVNNSVSILFSDALILFSLNYNALLLLYNEPEQNFLFCVFCLTVGLWK